MTLKDLNTEIAATYGSIANNIDELLFLMNEAKGGKGEIARNAKSILPFLRRLKRSIDSEKNMVDATIRKNEPFLLSLEKLLDNLMDLQAFIQLASKGNEEKRVIEGINILNKAILRELKDQREIVSRAA